jgi:DNA-binding MarR family transcriptional regulator
MPGEAPLNVIFGFFAEFSAPNQTRGGGMSIIQEIRTAPERTFLAEYLETLSMVERLHRLLLDVIKDEFERLGILEINAVQALLLFNIGENEVTAGELKTRGYYQGSNVSYNLKKLVDLGYMHHERCQIDRRSVRVRLTAKGRDLRLILSTLFTRHADILARPERFGTERMVEVNASLQRMERFWTDQIRYIY